MPEDKKMIHGESGNRPKFTDSLLQLFFPERCLLCRALLPFGSARPICESCDNSRWPIGAVCPRCDCIKRELSLPCGCRLSGDPLQGLFALSYYEGPWRNLLHDLKYRGRRSIARPLGSWLAAEINRSGYCCPQLIVPVPLHRHKVNERGFNQSALLSLHLSKYLGIPFQNLLTRKRDTQSQTKISRRDRLENVRDAFSCSKVIPANTTVLLVDDIYSTGATLQEAAKILNACGARVYGAVIAYNPLKQGT